MVRETLAETDQVVREVAEGGRAVQQCHVRTQLERRDRSGEPSLRRLAVDRRGVLVEQRATGFGLLVAKHDPCAGR